MTSKQALGLTMNEFAEANAEHVTTISKLEQKLTDMAVHLANAESKCREMAAENAHARERHLFIRALAVSIIEHSGGRMDWRGAMEDATELLQTVDSVYAITPATDAFLAEVRASGADAVANQHQRKFDELLPINVFCANEHGAAKEFAEFVATQLRKGAAL